MQVTRATFIPLLAAANSDRIDPGAVRDEYSADLTVVYTFGPQFGRRVVTHADLEQMELSARVLRRSAYEHLEVLSSRAEFHGQPPALMLSFEGLESSLLLASDFWTRLQGAVPGEVVVGVPARDVVIVTGSQSLPGLEKARRCVERVFMAGGENPLTQGLLVRRGGTWEPFDRTARPSGARSGGGASHQLGAAHQLGQGQPPRQYQEHPSWPGGERVAPVPQPQGQRRAAPPAGARPQQQVAPAAALPPRPAANTLPPTPGNLGPGGPLGANPLTSHTSTGMQPVVPHQRPVPGRRSVERQQNAADVAQYSSVPYSSVPYSSVPNSGGPGAPQPGGPQPAGSHSGGSHSGGSHSGGSHSGGPQYPQAQRPHSQYPQAQHPQSQYPQAQHPQAAASAAAAAAMPYSSVPYSSVPYSSVPYSSVPYSAVPHAAAPGQYSRAEARPVSHRDSSGRSRNPQATPPQAAMPQAAMPQAVTPQATPWDAKPSYRDDSARDAHDARRDEGYRDQRYDDSRRDSARRDDRGREVLARDGWSRDGRAQPQDARYRDDLSSTGAHAGPLYPPTSSSGYSQDPRGDGYDYQQDVAQPNYPESWGWVPESSGTRPQQQRPASPRDRFSR